MMNKTIVIKAKKLLESEDLSTMFHMLMGPDAMKRKKDDDELETIIDIWGLANILARLVENDEMRELEHQFDLMMKEDTTEPYLVKDTLKLAEEIFDTVLQLREQNTLILWQPKREAATNGR